MPGEPAPASAPTGGGGIDIISGGRYVHRGNPNLISPAAAMAYAELLRARTMMMNPALAMQHDMMGEMYHLRQLNASGKLNADQMAANEKRIDMLRETVGGFGRMNDVLALQNFTGSGGYGGYGGYGNSGFVQP
jgi:hypothetical protein